MPTQSKAWIIYNCTLDTVVFCWSSISFVSANKYFSDHGHVLRWDEPKFSKASASFLCRAQVKLKVSDIWHWGSVSVKSDTSKFNKLLYVLFAWSRPRKKVQWLSGAFSTLSYARPSSGFKFRAWVEPKTCNIGHRGHVLGMSLVRLGLVRFRPRKKLFRAFNKRPGQGEPEPMLT